ncbi:hypothetical protein CLV62_101485 [Dysgonomonas alginatilytica]|uniref:Uncharacterized protein n=1 Tax=Dysgonomonas alginatilytica TaxID=1605892 RepID=A0A2V3PWC6_9BACT|nr:hypothetical protein [Dysgonomonas alginatilytica]PXV69216.1 hypothetical protein CLV62_101485 [Dysgonomonas alginatilytica]
MKTDLYTKIILTVIAIRSTVNLLKELGIMLSTKVKKAATVAAPTQATPVDVNITHINGCALEDNYNGYVIPVEMIKNRDK